MQVWKKARRSNSQGNCVEVRRTETGYEVRNSRFPEGPVLEFTHAELTAFVLGVLEGDFDYVLERFAAEHGVRALVMFGKEVLQGRPTADHGACRTGRACLAGDAWACPAGDPWAAPATPYSGYRGQDWGGRSKMNIRCLFLTMSWCVRELPA